MPIQMSPRFNFEGLDLQKLRRNLRGKSTGRRKGHQDLSTESDVEEIQHEREVPQAPEALVSSRKSSPTIRTFNSQHLLPVNHNDLDHPRASSPGPRASSPLPLEFDPNAPLPPLPASDMKSEFRPRPPNSSQVESMRSPATLSYSSGEERSNFDLRAPPPNRISTTLDGLSDLLFSDGHLRSILHDPTLFSRFTAFLNRYQPNTAPVLIRYLNTQKALKAVEYANAIAETIQGIPSDHQSFAPCAAALVDAKFKERSKRSLDMLVADALPAFITHNLVKIVSDSIVKEVTGQQTPVMRDLLGGLAEVFCLSDPSLPDNPIIYASEEFYRTTQYGRDYVIGRNCRFLQGPKTDTQTVIRLKQALQSGQEICETMLNYRRDGTPFFNLLMMSPLHDNNQRVKYFIGAQVDISGLIEEGRGLESFGKYLAEKKARQREEKDECHARKRLTRVSDQSLHTDASHDSHLTGKPKMLKKLKELSEMFSYEEAAVASNHSRSNSLARENDAASIGSQRGRRPHTSHNNRPAKRVLIDGSRSDDEEDDQSTWALSSFGPSGKLPGIYQNYLLVRPYPSLRIIFVSPGLRIPGLLQSTFLSHVGAPRSVRDGLADAFSDGMPVTARISWVSNPNNQTRPSKLRESTRTASLPLQSDQTNGSHGTNHDASGDESISERGQTRWISCTPLLGSDDRVGVWMVVMVDKPAPFQSHPSNLPSGLRAPSRATVDRSFGPRVVDATIPPSASITNGGGSTTAGSDDGFTNGNPMASPLAGKIKIVNGGSGGKLYAQFLRDSQVGRAAAAESLAKGRGSEIGPRNRRESQRSERSSDFEAEMLGEELMGRLNTL